MINAHEYSQVHFNANIIKILWRQQQELLKHSPEYVTPVINNEDPLDIQMDLEGPKATPYEGGIFRVKLLIPNGFPITAPKGVFITKIFHPNISEKGEICVNALKKDWNPRQWSLYNLFEVIKCLLIVPFPQSALNEEAGKIFMENYDEYFKIAKMFTKIYAMKNSKINISDDNNIKEKNKIKANNDNDIEMKDASYNNNDIDIHNNVINNNSNLNLNQSNFTKYEMHINNNILESIGTVDYRRMSEMPRSNYNLNYNNCNNITKSNAYCQSSTKNNNHNNIMNNSNVNCFNDMYHFNFNCNAENKQFLSSKEKPNLSLLPLMNTKQIKNNNNSFGYHRSLTFNNYSQNNNNYGNNNNNNPQEINKWLMRI